MTLKLIAASLSALAIILAGLIASISQSVPSQALGASALQTYDAINATTTLITISPNTVTSTLRLGPTSVNLIQPNGSSTDNTSRKFAAIQNVGSAPAYCGLQNATVGSSTISSSTYGFVLNASTSVSSRWIAQEAGSMYVGQVWCAGGSATTTLSVEEAN